MRRRICTAARHWSQIAVGDVVRTTSKTWTRVDRVDHHIEGLLTISGEDLSGSRRGRPITRWLGKNCLHLVFVGDVVNDLENQQQGGRR